MGNVSGQAGGACYNGTGCHPIIHGCHFEANSSSVEGGAIFTLEGSPTIVDCLFIGNSIGIRGGAVHSELCQPVFVSCRFLGNSSSSGGGAINNNDADAQFIQCLFSGNQAQSGGGAMRNFNSDPVLRQCTIASNTAHLHEGGGILNAGTSAATFLNCILWGNTHLGGVADLPAQVWSAGGPDAEVLASFTCVQGFEEGGPVVGPGNTGLDPHFPDADGADDVPGTLDDNLRLFFGSACIDAADNAAVPADGADLDGDGDTSELLPLDLDGSARQVDDPLAVDRGAGAAPVVDMGAYEAQPVCPGCPGPRLWIDPLGGAYADAANWHPDLPGGADPVVFALDASYTVTVAADAAAAGALVSGGSVTLDLAGRALDLSGAGGTALQVGLLAGLDPHLVIDGGGVSAPEARVGGDPGAGGMLTLDGAALLLSGTIDVGARAPGVVALANGASLGAAAVVVHPQGRLEGEGAIVGTLVNAGFVTPGGAGAHGTLVVQGDLQQQAGGPGAGVAATLAVDLNGDVPGLTHDVLAITGTAALGGRLVVGSSGGFEPEPGQAITILTAASITGAFDIAFLPPLPNGLVLTLEYDNGAGSGQAAVRLVAQELSVDLFAFDDPILVGAFLPPTDALLADMDDDGDLDVVLSVPAPDEGGPNDPGSVLVFRNLGTGQAGQWLGFDPGPVVTLVQENPVALAAGLFNDDQRPDLAVANLQFGKLSILHNAGGGALTEVQVIADVAGGTVAAGRLYGGELDDIVTGKFFGNDGAGLFSLVQSVPSPAGTQELGALDVDGDGDPEVIAAAETLLRVSFRNPQTGLFTSAADFYPLTPGTVAFEAGDLDGSGADDILTINDKQGVVSVLMNVSDGTGLFAPAVDLQVGAAPSALRLVDLDADGDLDLAVAAENESGERVLRLKRNDLVEAGVLGFTDTSPLLTGGPVQLVLSGDVDGDGQADLVAINVSGGAVAGGGASLAVHINAAGAPPCPADVTGDGLVSVEDLVTVVLAWGGTDPDADINQDGVVSVQDLVAVILQWGVCP